MSLHPEEEARLHNLIIILDQAGVNYEILAHPDAVLTAEEGVKRGMGSLAEMAPTLILQTEKGNMAAIISGATRLSFKKIKKLLGLKNISLASPDDVLRVTGAQVGSVSLVNQGVPTLIDSQLEKFPVVFGGCGIPYHTLKISPCDLILVTRANVFDFSEPKDQVLS